MHVILAGVALKLCKWVCPENPCSWKWMKNE